MKHTTEPSRYRVVIRGRLGERLASAFDSLEIESRAGESSLTGTFHDQAALHGLLDRLRDLGIPLVSVNPTNDHNERTNVMHDLDEVMPASSTDEFAPIALAPGEGEARWGFGMLGTLKATTETTDGRVFVVEHLAPQGSGSPLHVHHREDEWVYVNEGALTFWVGGQVIEAPAGSFVYGLRDVRHR